MSSPLEQRLLSSKGPPVISRYFSGAEPPESMSFETLTRYQTESLRAIVGRAYEKSQFYRDKMDKAGIAPEDIKDLSDSHKLPFLTKEELRGRPWLLLTCEREDIALIQVSTGTTGGEEIYMMFSWDDYMLNELAPLYTKLLPVGPGDVCVNALPYEMSTAGLAFHKTFVEGHHATVIPAGKGGIYSTPARTMKAVKDLRPNVVFTSPSWAVTLAEEAARMSLDLTSLNIKKMWLAGEGCSEAFRRRLEALWGTTANFFYGSLECGFLGIECDEHNGFHVAQAHTLLEVIDPKTQENLPAGRAGELVATALLRYDSPVIRFRTGDAGYMDAAPCACGATLPRFHMRGRAQDQIQHRGRSLSPIYLEESLLRMPEVGNWFQFVTPGPDSDRIKVRCELSPGVQPVPGMADALARTMEQATGIAFDLELKAFGQMPRPQGKALRVVPE